VYVRDLDVCLPSACVMQKLYNSNLLTSAMDQTIMLSQQAHMWQCGCRQHCSKAE